MQHSALVGVQNPSKVRLQVKVNYYQYHQIEFHKNFRLRVETLLPFKVQVAECSRCEKDTMFTLKSFQATVCDSPESRKLNENERNNPYNSKYQITLNLIVKIAVITMADVKR
jgi:hypothetical protein